MKHLYGSSDHGFFNLSFNFGLGVLVEDVRRGADGEECGCLTTFRNCEDSGFVIVLPDISSGLEETVIVCVLRVILTYLKGPALVRMISGL